MKGRDIHGAPGVPKVMARNSPGVHFPPPLLFVAGFGLGAWLQQRWPWPVLDVPAPVGWAMLACGLGIVGAAMLTFARVGTAIFPNRPATEIVARGPYRWSRNPMYVGMSTAYLGGVLVTGFLWPLPLLPIVLAALWHLVIRHEERYLSEAFGERYEAYTRSVRRWI